MRTSINNIHVCIRIRIHIRIRHIINMIIPVFLPILMLVLIRVLVLVLVLLLVLMIMLGIRISTSSIVSSSIISSINSCSNICSIIIAGMVIIISTSSRASTSTGSHCHQGEREPHEPSGRRADGFLTPRIYTSYALARAAAILSTLEAIALPPGRTGLLLTRGIGLCGGPGHIAAQLTKEFKATLTKTWQLQQLQNRKAASYNSVSHA